MEDVLRRLDQMDGDVASRRNPVDPPSVNEPGATTPKPVISSRHGDSSAFADDAAVVAALRRIAAWAAGEHGARTVFEALEAFVNQTGDDQTGGRAALAGTDAAAFAGDLRESFDAARLFTRLTTILIDGADERDLEILERRILGRDRGDTLQDLGDAYHVSRERIRQIEARWRKRIDAEYGRSDYAPLRRTLQKLAATMGGVVPARTLHACLSDILGQPGARRNELDTAGRLALLLAGPYLATDDGWYERADTDGWQQLLERRLQDLAASDDPSEAAMHQLVEEQGLPPEIVTLWLGRSGRFRIKDGILLDTSGAWADRAVRALRYADRPLTVAEIEALIDEPSTRSITARIWTDPRLMRTAKNKLGLREWGGEEYSGIVEEIRQSIARHGGAATSTAIGDDLVQRFGVSRSSISAYLATAHFRRDDQGLYRVDVNASREIAARPIELTRGCFFHDGWVHGLPVAEPMMRGSGFPIANGFAGHLGLRRLGDSRDFTTDWGTVRIARGTTNSSCSSIRLGLKEGAARPGDLVFLRPLRENRLAIRVIVQEELALANGPRHVLLRMGRRVEEADETAYRSEIAETIGLPRSSTWEDIRNRLGRRGEQLLADLLPIE